MNKIPENDAKPALPEGVSFWHPATLVSTWFGCGLLPVAPGTWGSLAALPLAWVIAEKYGALALMGAGFAFFLVGLWAAGQFLKKSDEKDPGIIVIDEVAGQMLALVPAAAALAAAGGNIDMTLVFGLGFILFRIFDIMKPWPANVAERKLPGALGVMADDVVAALYAGVCISIFFMVLE